MEPSSNEAWFLHPVTREGEDHILYHLIITLLLGISSTFTQGTGYLMSTKASEHPAVICPSSPQVINIAKKVFLFTFKVCKWMPKNAAWFLSWFMSFRVVRERQYLRGSPPLPSRPAEGLSADFPAHSGSAPSPLRAPPHVAKPSSASETVHFGERNKKDFRASFWEKKV